MTSLVAKIAAVALATLAPAALVAAEAQSGNAFDFSFTAIDGKPMPLADWKGRVLLVVNTASMCGFTPQYKGLQTLHEAYSAAGLVVLGVPSNDFGGQEPGSSEEIKSFCEGAFGITFPLTEKTVVTGAAAHPFYGWAKQTLGKKGAPGWNFHKYLIGRDGRLISSFSSFATPDSEDLKRAIEAALAEPASG